MNKMQKCIFGVSDLITPHKDATRSTKPGLGSDDNNLPMGKIRLIAYRWMLLYGGSSSSGRKWL